MVGRFVVGALGLLLVSGLPHGGQAFAQEAVAPAPAPASAGEYEKLVQYFRKKNNVPPAQAVSVKDVKDSAVASGAKQGILVMGTPPRARELPFTVSSDGRYVVFGEVDDITVDPAKAIMSKVGLTDEIFKGPADAKVTIVEYSDFQCPFCSRGYNTIEKDVLPAYEGKVKFYYKHLPLPFHNWAEPGAIAMECIKKQNADAAWNVYKGYFDHQKEVTLENVKAKALEYAGSGIDKAQFDTCYDNKEVLAKIQSHKAEASSLGISGTPSFVINGRILKGAQPADQFKAVIDDELKS